MPNGALCALLLVFAMLDPKLVSIIDKVSPAGTGPDGPLLSESVRKQLSAIRAAESSLLALVADHSAPPDRRFVAAEALFEEGYSDWRAKPEARRDVADVLANALARDSVHNRWGLPGEFVGSFGKNLLAVEPESDEPLRGLLDDNRPLSIVGSEAATLNTQAGYRVSDLAAWLLASAHHLPWKNDPDPHVRDAEILRLRNTPPK
jgi:hypothetical protein